MSKNDLTLALIVKNEAQIIERCLASVRPYVSRMVIHDTGSTDDTIDIVGAFLERYRLTGYITFNKWVDFGHNRSALLADARIESNDEGYTLMLDADEVLCGDAEDLHVFFANLVHDTYQMDVHLGDCRFRRNFLFKNSREWEFCDPVHEYAHVDGDFTSGHVSCGYILSRFDGARNREGNKFEKDAKALEAIENRTPRQQFYLAQSYKDAGEDYLAESAYRCRLQMGEGYEQERFYSAYMLGKLTKDEKYYLKAYEIDPTRAEPLLAMGKHYMDKGNFAAAEMFLCGAQSKIMPTNALFVETDVYMWRSALEHAVCLYYLGKYAWASTINQTLLTVDSLPNYAHRQIVQNEAFVSEKLNDES